MNRRELILGAAALPIASASLRLSLAEPWRQYMSCQHSPNLYVTTYWFWRNEGNGIKIRSLTVTDQALAMGADPLEIVNRP